MKEEYDFSQSVNNPDIKKLKKQVTIRLEDEVVSYFKQLAEETGVPYQTLINLYSQGLCQNATEAFVRVGFPRLSTQDPLHCSSFACSSLTFKN